MSFCLLTSMKANRELKYGKASLANPQAFLSIDDLNFAFAVYLKHGLGFPLALCTAYLVQGETQPRYDLL